MTLRLVEACLTPRRRRLTAFGERFGFVRSVWWDNTAPEFYDREIAPYFQALGDRLAPRVVVDCGAAEGYFAVTMARLCPGATIYAFEPSRRQRVLLRRNAQENRCAGQIQIIPLAMWNQAGVMAFRTHGDLSALQASGVLPDRLPFLERVQTIPLDEWVRRRAIDRIDLIKMDIEGAELEALEGAREVLCEWHPELLVQAYHQRGGIPTKDRCAAFLCSLGYICKEEGPTSGFLHATHPRVSASQ